MIVPRILWNGPRWLEDNLCKHFVVYLFIKVGQLREKFNPHHVIFDGGALLHTNILEFVVEVDLPLQSCRKKLLFVNFCPQ